MLFFPGEGEQERAVERMQEIQQKFFSCMQKENPELAISLSVGGTVRKENEDFKTLYRKADIALYQAKQKKGELRLS